MYAAALQAEVLSSVISPGDAFLIRVTGSTAIPEALLGQRRFVFSGCGEGYHIAVAAVEFETEPGPLTVRIKTDKEMVSLPFMVGKATFPELSLRLPDNKVFLSLPDRERAERESLQLRAIFRGVSERLWDGGFILPLDNGTSTGYGVKRIINNTKISVHKGLDLRGEEGAEVRASNTGRVVLAEELFFGGNTLVLDHGQGIYSVYMHLSAFKARPGSVVTKGGTVGLVGSTGRASGPHLHFGTKVLDISVNPQSLLEMDL